MLGLWCLPLGSTRFELYRGDQFYYHTTTTKTVPTTVIGKSYKSKYYISVIPSMSTRKEEQARRQKVSPNDSINSSLFYRERRKDCPN